ncbi:uroporphyrinogen decarboxylase family protein [Chloroflexota bacterium]
MNSRQRAVQAMNHQEPDRIPIDLGGTICSSLHRDAYITLKRHLGMEVEEVKLADHFQQLPYLDEALSERFASDFRMIQLPAAAVSGPEIFEDGDYLAFVDDWGAKVHMPIDGGLYFDWVEFPIKEPTQEALDAYAWPEPDPPEYLARLKATAKHLYETTDFALTGSGIIGGGIFEQPATTMGYESFLIALLEEPAFADRLMERITEIYIEANNKYLDCIGDYLHVFVYCDDICGQDGWLVSPDLYRRMIKPKQRRLIEAIKSKTQAKIFYHGCGAVSDQIPDLIDIGVDIINPVQVSARGMDTRRLKKEYGSDVVFWGGGVDTQHVLPFGTPQEVSDEVKRRIDDLAPGGGFVFAAVHNIQAMVPPENIVALFETALEYGTYG